MPVFVRFLQNDEKVIEKANQLIAEVNQTMAPPSEPVSVI